MGCDGGTIPRRDELVRVKKKPEQKDKDAEREFRWLHCALTQERLQEPIVMCGLGRLYSKQNVLEGLLEKDKMPESVRHIRTMKDIRLLKLTRNPAYTAEDKSEGLLDTRAAPYICKLIGLEMSGKFRFVALWSCGHVMSERALKQIKKANSSSQVCPICQVPFNVDDVIVLNGNEEDLELMQAKMEMRQERLKAGKKDKKEKEKKAKTIDEEKSDEEGEEKSAVKPEYEGPSTSKGKPAASGSSKSDSKLTKLVVNPKRLGATANTMEDPEIKRLKTEYSVAKDPKATDVYKSLFTTHDSEKEQNRAHWVTYNPFYN